MHDSINSTVAIGDGRIDTLNSKLVLEEWHCKEVKLIIKTQNVSHD